MDGKKLSKFWTGAEAEYKMQFHRDLRAMLEADQDREVDDEENMAYLKESVAALMEKLKYLQPPKTAAIEPSEVSVKKRGRYRKSFDRRYYLLDFVTKAKGGIHTRANWRRIADAWNKVNPSDTITPGTLKREYNVAHNDDDVTSNWIGINCGPQLKALGKEIVKQMEGVTQAWSRNFPGIQDALKRVAQDMAEDMGKYPEAKTLNDLIRLKDKEGGAK
jgi:hypothetical protein